MSLKPFNILLFLILLTSVLPAQEDGLQFPIRIDGVVVAGNEQTKEEVILREIPFEFPRELTLEDLELIQNRITNLQLFNRVELAILPTEHLTMLLIQVAEILYLYPIPLLFLNERDWDKVSYGFQLTHVNFRGMHERLSIGGWLGFNPSFFLNYYNPWVGKKSRFILGVNGFGKSVGNKFYDFKERHLGGGITLGKRLGHYNRFQLSLGLRQIADLPTSLSVSGDEDDILATFSLDYRNDHRDLIEYPRSGYYIRWTLTRAGFTDSQPQYWRFQTDHRAYLKLSERISIGGKNLLKLGSRDTPLYSRSFIGFGDRIRGHFNEVLTGQNIMLHNVEMRISLLPVRYLSWQDAPGALGAFFQQLKYGLSLGLFMDSGTVWGHNIQRDLFLRPIAEDGSLAPVVEEYAPLSLKDHLTGFGVGLHIHLPYIQVFRIDHAWNEDGDREWILEARVVF